MIKKFFAVRMNSNCVDAALLLMRLVVGVAFVLHGWDKIQNPMGWMGPMAPVPGVFQALAAISEFGGGLALILGLLCRLGSLGICFTMLGALATMTFMFHAPFVDPHGGPSSELPAAFFAVAFLMVMNGPGKFSVDRYIFGTR